MNTEERNRRRRVYIGQQKDDLEVLLIALKNDGTTEDDKVSIIECSHKLIYVKLREYQEFVKVNKQLDKINARSR